VTALEGAGLIGEADGGDEGGGEGYTEDEVNEMDADELKAVIKEHELDVKPLAKIAKFRAAVIEALEAEDLIKEDAGDDEKYSEDDVNGMDADELGELVKKHSLDVKPLARLSKYRAAVIDALEAEDLIGDDED